MVELAADLIAVSVQRCNDFANKLTRLVQHLLHQVLVDLGKRLDVRELPRCLQHLMQQGEHLAGVGLIGTHA